MLQTISNILVLVCFLECLAFLVLYMVKAPWYKSEFGRLLWFSYLVKGILFGLIGSRTILGPSALMSIVTTIVFGLMPIYMGWQLAILIKLQWQKGVNNNGSSNS